MFAEIFFLNLDERIHGYIMGPMGWVINISHLRREDSFNALTSGRQSYPTTYFSYTFHFFLIVYPKPKTINKAKKARMRLIWFLSKCA